MKNPLLFLLLVAFAQLIVSCHSGRKTAFTNAYRFHLPQQEPRSKPTEPLITEVSVPKDLSTSNTPDLSLAPHDAPDPNLGIGEPKGTGKIQVKELRQTIKSYKQEIKTLYKAKKPLLNKNSEQVTDGHFAKGLLLLILGLIAIVLSIMFFNSLGTVLAAIIAAVGLILFLMGLLGLIL